ncbi:MAG: alpha/beta fold hydrolase [Candidatus Kapabacteria bacterium]|nr:alpha/beta fold hydrolase [Candidatus Kapabacteria bacterium]
MRFKLPRPFFLLVMGVMSIPFFSDDAVAQQKEEWRHVKQERYGRYRVKVPAGASLGKVYPLVVLLHGNGNAPELMMRWARDLKLDSFVVVCPEAPYVKVPETIQSQEERYTAMADAIGIPDSLVPEAITYSADWYYNVVLDAQRTLPVDPLIKPVLIGFSQGGFYAQVVLTRHPETFRKVVTVSASMYAAGKVLERLPLLASSNVDILLVHARMDPVVPFQTGELINSAFEEAKVKHTFLPFDGGHWPTQEVTEAISKWLL